ncbi:MAG: Flp family type IVb pilin [Myxococcales bacterium]|nr:Flp family type IVb pilin [Myxococcales bacterium]
MFKQLAQDESGATAIEYGLIFGLVAVAIIVALTALGDTLGGLF